MHRSAARRLTLSLLGALGAAAALALPAAAGDIARPFLVQSGPPVLLAKGVPTQVRAPRVPGGIQLSLTQAYPIQGGTLLQETFQAGLPRAGGYAVTSWVEVMPVLAQPYRVALLPSGTGVLQRSSDNGRHWKTAGLAQVRTTGSNVVFTLLHSDGATSDATVRAGWTAARPDGSGVHASGFPAVLGTLAGTGPWRLPALGLAATRAARSTSGRAARAEAGAPAPPGTCSVPGLAFDIDSTGLLVGGPGAWPPGSEVTVGVVPDVAGAFAPAYLRGSPQAGPFELFPPGLGGASTGKVDLPTGPNAPLFVPLQELIKPPLSLRGDGALTIIVTIHGGCELGSPVIPVKQGDPATAPVPVAPPKAPAPCDELRASVERMRGRIAADRAELAVAQASVARLEAALKLATDSGYAALAKAGFTASAESLKQEHGAAELRIKHLEDDIDLWQHPLKQAEKKLAGC